MKFKNVKHELIRQNLSMIEMAAYLEVDPAMMSTWLNGRRKMPTKMKQRVATYLGVPVDVLFTEDSAEYFRRILSAVKK